MKFRKKPVIIEAIQWTGNNGNDVSCFIKAWHRYTDDATRIVIETLEGDMVANLNDWIIEGVRGEFYPCKPDIFEQTYEPVEEQHNDNKD